MSGYTHGVKFYSFTVVIEKEPDDPGYYAYSPTLPGCFSNGLTIEETRRNMREAIQLHVDWLTSDGEAVPQTDGIVHVERVTIPAPIAGLAPQPPCP